MQLTVAESSYFTGCSLLLQNAAVLQGAADCYRVQLTVRVQLYYRVQLTITESSCVTVCS